MRENPSKLAISEHTDPTQLQDHTWTMSGYRAVEPMNMKTNTQHQSTLIIGWNTLPGGQIAPTKR